MPSHKLGSITASLGKALGTGISQPINQALDVLAQRKVQQLQRGDLESTLTPLLGAERAKLIAGLPPELQKPALQNVSMGSAGQGEAGGQLTPQQTADLFTSSAEKRQQETLGIKQSKEARERSKDVRAFSKPYIEKADASRKNIKDYKMLIKLAEQKGPEGLRAGPAHQILSKFGLEDFNQNFNTQLASKLTARLGQNIGSAFGGTGKITNFLEQTFQKSLPSLWNTTEGIKAISESNMLADEANIVTDNARKAIIRENKGMIPDDIDDQIRERAQPELDKLEERAISVLENATKNVVTSFEDIGENEEFEDQDGNRYKRVRGQLLTKPKGSSRWKAYQQ